MQSNGQYFLKTSPDYTVPEANVVKGITVLSGDQQYEALAQAQSIYYLSIMIMQGFNLFASKSKLRPPFGKHMFSNYRNFIGLSSGFLLGMAIVYLPPFNVVFGSSYKLAPIYWLIPTCGGIGIVLYASLRFLIRKSANSIKYNQDVHGLQMHPTVFTNTTLRTQ